MPASPAPAVDPAPEAPALPEGHVSVRITKHGDGQVSTGQGVGETFPKDTIVALPRDVAEALEVRAFAEIQD